MRPAPRRATAQRALATPLSVVLACGVLTCGVLACGPAHGRPTATTTTSPSAAAANAWTQTAVAARTALMFRQHARADSVLAAYTARYPESSGAAEATYWRSLARLDPDNPGANDSRAVAGLDAYRATDPPREHFYEAGVLSALALQADSLRAVLVSERSTAAAASAAAASVRAGLVPRDSLRARDEALARALTDAADARAELERVRRRLSAPDARGRRFP